MDGDMMAMVEQVTPLAIEYGMNLLGAIIILLVGWKAASWLESTTKKSLMNVKNFDKMLAVFLSNMVRYLVLAFTVMAVLSKFGVQTASLVALLGAAGLAIGLAMQGTLGHIASGVMLLIFRPFTLGDYVEVGGQAGTVQAITLFTTEMTTPDNVQITIPNGQVWDQAVKNYSRNDTRRVDITVGIDYEASMDEAMKTLDAVIKKDKRVLKTPEHQILITNLGDSAVDVTTRIWTKNADYWGLKFDLTKAFKEALDAKGISIPFPQRTMHLVSSDSAALTKSKSKKAA